MLLQLRPPVKVNSFSEPFKAQWKKSNMASRRLSYRSKKLHSKKLHNKNYLRLMKNNTSKCLIPSLKLRKALTRSLVYRERLLLNNLKLLLNQILMSEGEEVHQLAMLQLKNLNSAFLCSSNSWNHQTAFKARFLRLFRPVVTLANRNWKILKIRLQVWNQEFMEN
jgi:membrane-associated HD superfamily phosphohydrolase